MYKHSTQVPNILFDVLLKDLSPSEVKVLLVVIRQTNGWVDKRYGGRRKYARISHTLFMDMCGLSRRSVCGAIALLVEKRFVEVTDREGVVLSPTERRGRWCLYYRCLLNFGERRVRRKGGSGWIGEMVR